MITRETQEKQVGKHALIGILLFVIAIVLSAITGPIGLVSGIVYSLVKGTKNIRHFFDAFGRYFLQMAITLDQHGNVMMQHLFNLIFIKKKGYKFGNRKETISSVLGKNKKHNTLNGFGKGITAILDFLDPNHALNSIDYVVDKEG